MNLTKKPIESATNIPKEGWICLLELELELETSTIAKGTVNILLQSKACIYWYRFSGTLKSEFGNLAKELRILIRLNLHVRKFITQSEFHESIVRSL